MRTDSIRYSRTLVSRLLMAAVVVTFGISPGHAPIRAQQPAPQDPTQQTGRSVTILADGRRLFIGGDSTRRVVAVEDPVSGTLTTLAASPRVPRTWHTATLLADGTVLVVGGLDANGRSISAPERFDLSTQVFEPLPADGFAPRARHTATLLTDGRVLIVGGQGIDSRSDAELWSPETQSAMVLQASMHEPRSGHTATLLADGRVLFEGGDTFPARRLSAEVYDPALSGFDYFRERIVEPRVPVVVATDPANGAIDVPTGGRLSVRFSTAMSPASVTAAAVSVSGPDGPVDVVVIPAERGMLAFVWPLQPLAPSTDYTLRVDGPLAPDSRPLTPLSSRFTTAKDDRSADVVTEPEDWDPELRAGRGWRTNRPDSPWQRLSPLHAPAGVTALAGQALTLNGQPLAGVSLTIRGQHARTDKTGRFLLPLRGVGDGRHQLEIEGATANRPGRTYGFYEVGVRLTAGQTSVLPYTIWMSRIDTARTVTLASPTSNDVVITTPKIPGLELHLPRGTVIKDRQGRVVREVSITPIPVDRPPFPLPAHIDVPVYFTIQPGGAFVYSSGYRAGKARLIYPNYYNTPKDVIASFWHYDPEELDWYVYGAGKVMGRQVVPDPGVGIYEFTGAMMESTNPPPPEAPAPGGGPRRGDPVDVATGLFLLEKRDLFVRDVLPIDLVRTYRQSDAVSRPFGIGSSHPYAMRLWSAQNYQQADLVLPDGGRVHYVRTSAGTGFADAIYEHTTTPTAFHKSKIAWNGVGWDLTLRDGTVYVFGDFAPLQSIRDRFGNTITIEHTNGEFGNVSKVTSHNGRWLSFTYDGSNRITQITDHIGRTVGYQYDASGRLWKVTDAAGGVTEYTYDGSHRMLTIKDPRNIVFLTNTYDANGRVATQTQADSTTWGFAYTLSAGKVTQADVTDPRGHVTRSTFNASGYELTSTEAHGLSEARTTTYTREVTSNRVTRIVDPLSRQTDYAYDTNGNVTSVTRLGGTTDAVTTSFTYAAAYDELASVTDPLNHATNFTRDTLGRLTKITDALGNDTTFTYNAAGQPLTITNDAGETTHLTYDLGDAVSITNPAGHSTLKYFDVAGRLLQVIDPAGGRTKYEYTALNLVNRIVDPLGGQTTFTFDANGNMLTLTDARGKTTTWTYDNMDRVATRTDPLSRAESFSYDENGALKTWTDRKGQVTVYTYDPLDRNTFVGYGRTGTPPTYASTITTTYDAGDRATSIVDSVAGTITRTYDLLDRLTQEATPEGTIAYTYDAAGRRATLQVTGQTPVSYTYDNADRLTALTKGTATVTTAYDTVDRRTSLTLPNGVVAEYTYDTASRLTGLTYKLGGTTLGNLAYTYNAKGQRISVDGTYARANLPAALASATYDDANQIATWAGTSFTYDLNGNLTSDGLTSYTWNARNQLVGLTGGASASFVYDGVGRRRGKTINGTTTNFLYDGLTFVQELSAGGTPTANLLTGMGIDEVFRRTDSAGARDPLIDALGSALALADGSGTVQTSYTYEPFGLTSASGTSSTNPGQFTGRENDGTGLYFYRARYYSPGFQRFVGEDPLDFQGGSANLYSYVLNNPISLLDPLGLWVRNLDPNRSVPVKPEDGPWGKLPPCSEWPGSPDGLLDPGSTAGPPWHKTPGEWWLPDNDVLVTPDGKVTPVGGPATWPRPWPWRYERLPQAPDPTWIPPKDLPDLPGIKPIPGCKPKGSKSDQ